MTNMTTSLDGMIEICSHEGICLNIYLDSVGVRTIGIGATVTEIPNINKLPWTYEITIKEAFDLFKKSLKKYENAINKAVKVPIKQYQFDALVSWCYNVGVGWPPKASVIQLLNSGVYGSNAAEKTRLYNALMQYKKPPEIVGRRRKEANLLTNGRYGDGKALLFPVSPTSHKPLYSKGKTINVRDYL